ncbi:TPA: hypothetical protein ACJIWU_001740 [Enterobacter chengduensis]|uniref:hypothetical protein n=1 Tax=Enterobacter cloacae complex TaxID=354276 RepID=UPI001F5CECF7|nr:hypothetical protein [Enterobacter chengduensis]MCK6820624.1 hypothetical protein [Enterobacter chengduensis]MCK7169915.1 hypothetical protein [Enterobacter chengduensis]MCM7517660.1 hypothetical protein [Enterobacter chengduensis]MCW4820016.1 hypothetical protein [Enterobacter chengduensis]MCW5066965.1 hypothetical protein [Enterobacter chengduensis]
MFFHAFSAPALNIDPFLGREAQRLHEFSRGGAHDGNAHFVPVAGKQQSVMALAKRDELVGIHCPHLS